ncbi:MAG TPA: hypothetical protein VD926_04220 [Acidimicrobiales bacterium]|nr:hypothetical protein [Acidimicrobiales bacterium]
MIPDASTPVAWIEEAVDSLAPVGRASLHIVESTCGRTPADLREVRPPG